MSLTVLSTYQFVPDRKDGVAQAAWLEHEVSLSKSSLLPFASRRQNGVMSERVQSRSRCRGTSCSSANRVPLGWPVLEFLVFEGDTMMSSVLWASRLPSNQYGSSEEEVRCWRGWSLVQRRVVEVSQGQEKEMWCIAPDKYEILLERAALRPLRWRDQSLTCSASYSNLPVVNFACVKSKLKVSTDTYKK